MALYGSYFKTVVVQGLIKSYTPQFTYVLTGQIDTDGLDDILVLGASYPIGTVKSPTPQPGRVLLSTASDQFVPAAEGQFPLSTLYTVHPRKVLFADFNGDGRNDIFISSHGWDTDPFPGEQNRLYLSRPDGGYTDATATLPQMSDYSHSAAAGDIDGDGDMDIVVGNGYAGQNKIRPYVLINDGTGHFTQDTGRLPVADGQVLDILKGNQFPGTILRDLDGDGRPDLIVTADASGPFNQFRKTTIFWNVNGSFSASAMTQLPETTAFSSHIDLDAATLDINNDGLQDLVLIGTQGNPFYDGSFIQVFLNKGQHQFVDVTATVVGAADARQGTPGAATQTAWPIWVKTLDFNGDGLMDVAVQYNGGSIKPETPLVWLNDGQGHLVPLRARDFEDVASPYPVTQGNLIKTANGYSFVTFFPDPSGGLSMQELLATKPFDAVKYVIPASLSAREAAVATTGFFTGAAPDAASFEARVSFAQNQFVYYRDVLGVANPAIGPYEALGLAFSETAGFQARFGAASTTSAFVNKAYQDVFGRAPTASQQNALAAQVDYFKALYLGAGIDAATAGLHARGAVAGQMIGYAMTSAEERSQPGQTLDDKVAVFLAGVSAGTNPYGLPWS